MSALSGHLSFLSRRMLMGQLDRVTHGSITKFIHEKNEFFRLGTSVTDERMRRTPGCIHGDMFVISWILTGEGEYREDGISYRLTDGTICVRRPDRDYVMELTAAESIRLFLDLPEPMYRAMLLLVPELSALPPVREAPFRQELFDEFMSLYAAFEEAPTDELYALLPAMIRFLCAVTGIFDDRERQPLLRAKRMLEDTASTLTLEEIARRCDFNYHTFRRDFTEAFGMPPGKYRQEHRMRAACRMLALGDSVTSVAAQLGYPDVYTFTHRFTAEMGMPPSRYAGDRISRESDEEESS